MYNDIVLNLFKNLDNAGKLIKPDAKGEAGSEEEGVVVQFVMHINDGIIENIHFKAFADVITTACCELVCRKLKMKTLNEAASLTKESLEKELKVEGIDNNIRYVVEAVIFALYDYRNKLEKSKSKADE